MDEQRKWFLEMEFIPNKEALKIVETTKDLDYYVNLVNEKAIVFERTDSNFEKVLWVKLCQTAVHATENCSWKEESNAANFIVLFKWLLEPYQSSATTILTSQQHQYCSKILHQEKDYVTEGSDDG